MPFSENTVIDEGVSENGVRRQIHIEGDDVTLQQTFDAEPYLKAAEIARQSTAGMGWGEGRIVGTIDPVSYTKINAIKDRTERDKAIRQYFRDHPAMVKFDGYYKTLAM